MESVQGRTPRVRVALVSPDLGVNGLLCPWGFMATGRDVTGEGRGHQSSSGPSWIGRHLAHGAQLVSAQWGQNPAQRAPELGAALIQGRLFPSLGAFPVSKWSPGGLGSAGTAWDCVHPGLRMRSMHWVFSPVLGFLHLLSDEPRHLKACINTTPVRGTAGHRVGTTGQGTGGAGRVSRERAERQG